MFIINHIKWEYGAINTIGLNIKRSTKEVPRFDVSVRMLKVEKKGLVAISLRQK